MKKPEYFRSWESALNRYGEPILVEGNFQLAPPEMEVSKTLRCGFVQEDFPASIWPSCNKGQVKDNTTDCYYIPTYQAAREYCKKYFPDWYSKLPNANQPC